MNVMTYESRLRYAYLIYLRNKYNFVFICCLIVSSVTYLLYYFFVDFKFLLKPRLI